MRSPKKFYRTLLIVCEGESSEPSYFKGLAAKSIELGVFSNVEIFPRPRLDEDEKKEQEEERHGRPKKQFNAGTEAVPLRDVDLADDDERPFMTLKDNEERWPTPVRYIKEARDRMKTEGFDEIWAVFDKDGHAHAAAAFQLAAIPIEEKVVHIGFSSIAFEHWLLLHFDKCDTAFTKSECKERGLPKDKAKALSCGTGMHADDCWGVDCVVGRLKTNGYLPDYDKSTSIGLFKEVEDRTMIAIENAAWLRFVKGLADDAPDIFIHNPVVTIDILVKEMLADFTLFQFGAFDSEIFLRNLAKLQLSRTVNHLIIKIQSSAGESIHSNEFTLRLMQNEMFIDIKLTPVRVINREWVEWSLPIDNNIDDIRVVYRDITIILS